jgi:hypothetical protein
MHHPLVKTFEGNSTGCRVSKNRRGSPITGFVNDWVIGFEWRVPIGHDKQCGTVPAEPGDLKVARVFTNVWVIERTFGVGLFKGAIVKDNVEDNRDA